MGCIFAPAKREMGLGLAIIAKGVHREVGIGFGKR